MSLNPRFMVPPFGFLLGESPLPELDDDGHHNGQDSQNDDDTPKPTAVALGLGLSSARVVLKVNPRGAQDSDSLKRGPPLHRAKRSCRDCPLPMPARRFHRESSRSPIHPVLLDRR